MTVYRALRTAHRLTEAADAPPATSGSGGYRVGGVPLMDGGVEGVCLVSRGLRADS